MRTAATEWRSDLKMKKQLGSGRPVTAGRKPKGHP
jgi:hypothetical protein